MPTYEYECDACEHRFEEFQNFSEEPLKKCPKCKKKKLRRLFGTGAAVLFKGSGFYETDYRSDSYKAAAKADQDASKSTPAETKSDSKAGKTDTAKPAESTNGSSKAGEAKSKAKTPKS
jgi:putative FmdB family regulatory protein